MVTIFVKDDCELGNKTPEATHSRVNMTGTTFFNEIGGLIEKMVKEDPSERISAYYACSHASLKASDDTLLLIPKKSLS